MARVAECLFCRIVAGEVPADVVRADERVLAFRDIDPQAPTHVLLVPRDHHADLAELVAADPDALLALHRAAAAVAADAGVAESGWRLVVNSGPAAGQSVPHVHAHLLGGRLLSWPPG